MIFRHLDIIIGLLSILVLISSCQAFAAGPSFNSRFKAVAFDYFVIFDPNSIVPRIEEVFPGKGPEFSRAWRSKQFEYCFIRSIANRYEDFFEITADALDYTAEQRRLCLPLLAAGMLSGQKVSVIQPTGLTVSICRLRSLVSVRTAHRRIWMAWLSSY